MNPSGSAKILATVLLGGLALGLAQGPAAAQLVKGASGLPTAAPGNLQLVRHQHNEWFWAGGWWRHGPWADHGPVFGLRLAVVPVVQPVVVVAYRPWTPDWIRYCTSKYRSFDPSTGYYVTYRGERRFCR